MTRVGLALAVLVTASSVAAGQIRPPRPVRPAPVRPTASQDSSVRRDSLTRRDSLARPDTSRIDTTTVRWAEPDSVMQALLARQGYEITRFQATKATYNATTKNLQLDANTAQRAAVDRNGQVMVSDSTIFYNQANNTTTNLGRYVLNFPGSTEAPIRGVGQVTYNASARSAQFTQADVPFNNGENWYLHVNAGAAQVDSTVGGAATIYVRGGRITSCPDSVPDYFFQGTTMKRTSSGTVIARNVVLYIGDIPTLWLPFIFQNVRTGRVSGLLTTRFGISDIVRNSPTYHRDIENFGYYWAISDYMDAAAWVDWRSGAGGNSFGTDNGWLKYNGTWQYNWMNRFLSGNVRTSYQDLRNGSTNFALSWAHSQQFSHEGRLTLDMNYMTNTTIQHQTTFDPNATLATIHSSASYSRKIGPASLSLGGTRTQYPGRPKVEQTFPTVQVSTVPIKIGSHVTWTPSFSFSTQETRNIDQPGLFQVQYLPTGVADTLKRSNSSTQIAFNSPLKVFQQDLTNSFSLSSLHDRFPQQITLRDLVTGDSVDTRIFQEVYQTGVDWTPTFQLPPFRSNRWNLAPSVSLSNVDPHPFWFASERTNGRFVSQSKRLTYGLSATPTIYGLFKGIGPFAAFRHTLTPTLGYSYAPKADVSDDFLIATRQTRKGYLGSLGQNAVTFGLSTVLEGKVAGDSTLGTGGKLKILGLQMSSFNYNFERLSAPEVTSTKWWRGLTTERFSYRVSSDLIPGIEFSSDYSLFEGSTTSDTAVFSPYRETMSATLNLSRNANPLAVIARLFGNAVPAAQAAPVPPVDPNLPPADQAVAREQAALPVAGARQAGPRFVTPPSGGWRASLTLSSSRHRPFKGGTVVNVTPETTCAYLLSAGALLYDQCIQQQRLSPTENPSTIQVPGGVQYNTPPTMNVGGNLGFNLTPHWSASWQTNYDFQRHEFASHVVSLQRDLHDWRANFGFTQSPNGNFAFQFSISLKAQPDLKFDYARNSIRSQYEP